MARFPLPLVKKLQPLRSPVGLISKLKANDTNNILASRTGPTINRGKGNNNASTPMAFIRPVMAKFGPLEWDLAASRTNTKAPLFVPKSEDSLSLSWEVLTGDGLGPPLCWLNPPFTTITPWAKK